jgi:hypothetical protein
VQLLVDHQRQLRSSRNELDSSVVVGWPQPTRDDAEIRAQSFYERCLELVLLVADDRDQRRLEPEPYELSRQERPVAIRPVAANELAAGDDDDATQTCKCRAQ